MTNLAPIIPLFAPVDCGCCSHHVCYPHRVESIADELRLGVDVVAGDAWVSREAVRGMVERLARELDAITAECLSTRRTAR